MVFCGGETPKEIDLYSSSELRENRLISEPNELDSRNDNAEGIYTSNFWLKHFNINSSQRDSSLERSFERRVEAMKNEDNENDLSFDDVKEESVLSFDKGDDAEC